MEHLIRNHQVNNPILVDRRTEILVVASREAANYYVSNEGTMINHIYYSRANAMVNVEHACDAIKTETVELIFIHPEPQVT